MQPRKLLFLQFFVLSALAFLYFLGLLLYLEWVFWWYDIVLHFLGGVWVALALYTAIVYFGQTPAAAGVIGGLIIVGILWEIFELAIGAPREANYFLDTSLDLLMDVLGGFFGFLIGERVMRAPKA